PGVRRPLQDHSAPAPAKSHPPATRPQSRESSRLSCSYFLNTQRLLTHACNENRTHERYFDPDHRLVPIFVSGLAVLLCPPATRAAVLGTAGATRMFFSWIGESAWKKS